MTEQWAFRVECDEENKRSFGLIHHLAFEIALDN